MSVSTCGETTGETTGETADETMQARQANQRVMMGKYQIGVNKRVR